MTVTQHSPADPSQGRVVLYRNGSVYTAADPFASAMLVDNGVVAWVGSEQAASSIADASMDIIDLQGALVAPGFVDSHIHLTETGMALAGLALGHVRSAGELLDAVAGRARAGNDLILGHGWDESTWPSPELPTPEQLERAAGGRMLYLARIDVHSALVSPALAAAAGLQGLEGYMGGSVVVKAAHVAARRFTRQLPAAARAEFQDLAIREASAHGYVALTEMAAPNISSPEDLRLAVQRNDAPVSGPEILAYWAELATSEEQARVLLSGLSAPVRGLAGDLNIDGSLGSRTAGLRADYADAPGSRGALYLSVEEAATHLAVCSLLGIQGGFHVIGDAGLDLALEALDRAASEVGESRVRAAGHRFEHVEMADDAAVKKLGQYSVSVSAQPVFDALWGGPGALYEQRLGSRSKTLNPFAAFYSAGVPIAFGSDSPVTPLKPWSSVRACVEHHNPDAQVSARAAFLGHTRAGWRAARYPDPMAGQLVPGAPASFAVWDVDELMVQVSDGRVQSWSTDPRARTPLLPALDTGSDPVCLQTVRNGVEIYSSGELGS